MKKAFIVSPFGEREGIDFDQVERALIWQVFDALEVDGGTTDLRGWKHPRGHVRATPGFRPGDCRHSIHNANVFFTSPVSGMHSSRGTAFRGRAVHRIASGHCS